MLDAAIDPQRWRALEQAYVDEAAQAVPGAVRRSSLGRPWHGMVVWEQASPVQDLYVPPTGQHCIVIRRGPPTRLLQQHGAAAADTVWHTGQAVLVPAGTPTFWRSELPRDNLHIDLSPVWLERAAGDTGAAARRLHSSFGTADALLQGLSEVLRTSLDDNTSLQAGFGDAMAMGLAVHLLEHYSHADAGRRPAASLSGRQLRQITDLVESRLDAPWPLETLAATLGLSPFHFARCFKASCGQSPHQFVTARRMQHARHLLLTGRQSVLEIAQETGYASAAHFAQVFRRHWGCAPSALRRSD